MCIKGKPHGIWPMPLAFVQRSARKAIEEGLGASKIKVDRADVSIVHVYVGDPVAIAPAPIFANEAEPA
jgi:hypothetical protein